MSPAFIASGNSGSIHISTFFLQCSIRFIADLTPFPRHFHLIRGSRLPLASAIRIGLMASIRFGLAGSWAAFQRPPGIYTRAVAAIWQLGVDALIGQIVGIGRAQ